MQRFAAGQAIAWKWCTNQFKNAAVQYVITEQMPDRALPL